jgi:large subunit ribosomal protein L21
MFAIVDIAGFQEKAEKGAKLRVSHLKDAKVGDTVKFEKVLLVSTDGTDAVVGKPYVAGAVVTATITAHGKGDKIVVRKFKRRKRYNKIVRGHRQFHTDIQITDIKQ